ncbi:sn-glycerol-1-phosphate dehydrogenase [Alkalihalobacillus sp. LMS39]|uniref:sn-glycerol-1-phosphate dehydrogenase n=1 Tax=Alkalihalobacillus sp. LMS39 TaxID=2924032 RepID=UPI001FB444E2|nr:sn-glycerol-1-phosphate dehydrogenase [Alkalihalobacillus sp. LMS39]UOE93586.1 sn-glycerol-1-phosphate dehydrogenase [Alkalihalobacillus sp. LMS39]
MSPFLSNEFLQYDCSCGVPHYPVQMEALSLSDDAFQLCVTFLEKKSFQHIYLVCDQNTYDVAGQHLHTLLSEIQTFNVTLCIVKPNELGDVTADATSITDVFIEADKKTDVFLAVGSGTIHDITRVVSYKMDKPFISIPTAPSVDGFNSMGAPLIIRGEKKTYQTHGPIALFGHMSVLMNSPIELISAGYGDMLAKLTSLVDWKFGHLIADEPYCPTVATMTKEALEACLVNTAEIANRTEKGIRTLMEALLQSGNAMLQFGQSHPASGAEHHLSHFWEMEFIKQKKRQVLHGAKVAVSTQIILDLYQKNMLTFLKYEFHLSSGIDHNIYEKLSTYKEEIIKLLESLPSVESIKAKLHLIGKKASLQSLGIEDTLLQASLKEAHLIRDRYTIMKFLNESEREGCFLEKSDFI